MKSAIDSRDKRIIEELRRNGRISHSDLARRVNLSRNAVRQRVERLENTGVIRGYTIVTDAHPSEQRHAVSAAMFVHRIDRMRGINVVNGIKSISEVKSCDVLSGELDLLVRVEAADAERLKQIWDYIANMDGVRDTVTSIVLR